MTVVLAPVPAQVFVDYVDHLDALLHEFRIIASGHRSGLAPVPHELFEVVDGVLSKYATVKDEAYAAARQALERGEDSLTLRVDLPAEAAASAEDLLAALERADALARQDELLTLPASPEVLRFARWGLPEVARQLRGEAPTAFPS